MGRGRRSEGEFWDVLFFINILKERDIVSNNVVSSVQNKTGLELTRQISLISYEIIV